MDYDRNDALLHWLFRQTQGDAWFRPNEENISSGVALRVSDAAHIGTPEFRVFPYEEASLEPFESAVAALNPVVAVKVRSAAVHAAFNEVSAEDRYIYVDTETRIQILDTMLMLPQADREQCAAFIRDERVMVIWSESIDRIVPLCQDFEERLIKLLWRSRPVMSGAPSDRTHGSLGGNSGASGSGGTPLLSSPNVLGAFANSSGGDRSSSDGVVGLPSPTGVNQWGAKVGSRPASLFRVHGGVHKGVFGELGRDPEDYDVALASRNAATALSEKPGPLAADSKKATKKTKKVEKRTWYGKKSLVEVPLDDKDAEKGAAGFGGTAATAATTGSDDTASLAEKGEQSEYLIGPDGRPLHTDDPKEMRSRWGIGGKKRPVKLFAPVYNGMAAGLALVFVGNGVRTLIMEWKLDGDFSRFALVAVSPMLYCVSLFFAMQIIQNLSMMVGPIAHFHENSKYYSAVKPKPNKEVDNNLPHITIQMPVYKESLDSVLAPSIQSLKKAMQTYARQGGTSNIFINDDGLRLLTPAERDARLAFYANHNIGWVARPRHEDTPDGFKRAGRFKKASNMNYGLALSLKMEKHLETLVASSRLGVSRDSTAMTRSDFHNASAEGPTQYGIQYQNRDGDESVRWGVGGAAEKTPLASPASPFANNASGRSGTPPIGTPTSGGGAAWSGDNSDPSLHHDDLEEKALSMAIEEMWEESGKKFRPWAANGRATRIGELVLIVDSDTVVPEDCLRDAAREMKENPTVAIIQHESDVLQVAHHYFENGIAYFTRRINRCISISCANGEVAPFMGHNAFLRWKAIQDAAFVDPADGETKIWSETNVSEDFDMALRLMLKGYIIRWATYSDGGFKEGVSLSVDDELNRWQKYAYGCNELLFNPIVDWWRKGPIAHQIHKFLWSRTPLHYKISMMAYMFSYYGIAGAITISLINYVLLGFQFPVDGFFMHSFEIWLATTVVFWGSGTVGYTLLEYRLGRKSLLSALFENLIWIPFFFFFFGGLAIPLTQAVLAHLFSYNMQWAATKKEVERSNFFKEIPKIAKRFWFPLVFSFVILAAIIILATPLVPLEYRVDGDGWAVILPLAMTAGCHILFPIVLNPWLMVFSY